MRTILAASVRRETSIKSVATTQRLSRVAERFADRFRRFERITQEDMDDLRIVVRDLYTASDFHNGAVALTEADDQ